MPKNYSLFDLAEPTFDLADYDDTNEILEVVLIKRFTRCRACDATTLATWQIMARGERKGKHFWRTDAAGMLNRFPTLPRRTVEQHDETGVCLECF